VISEKVCVRSTHLRMLKSLKGIDLFGIGANVHNYLEFVAVIFCGVLCQSFSTNERSKLSYFINGANI
jgi:hypothetical protein